MNESLACRGCRHLLTSEAGCALCLGVKPHLIISSTVDEDAGSLAEVATEAVAMLRKQLKHVKQASKLAAAYDPEISAEARAIANTLAKLLDSARKVVQDGADAVGTMSMQEQAALFLEWSAKLPGVYRRRLMSSMMDQADRVPETEVEDAPN
jgi:hypothetical protein